MAENGKYQVDLLGRDTRLGIDEHYHLMDIGIAYRLFNDLESRLGKDYIALNLWQGDILLRTAGPTE